MRPLLQKLPLSDGTSFVARTYRTPEFEVPWHQHEELELIVFTEGAGMSFIGNHVGNFETGDVFFLGADLPHTFQKSGHGPASAVVVQFRKDFWGAHFLGLPEAQGITKLFEKALQGLKIGGGSKTKLAQLVQSLETEKNVQRLITLLECLSILSTFKEYVVLSTQEIKSYTEKERLRIENVFQFTIENFTEPIAVSTVASIANMSIPAFCNYFKTCTKKTYINFLNEIRIGYACKLLADTQKTVRDICFESGYNTHTNFHKQFLKVKRLSPHQYRIALQKTV